MYEWSNGVIILKHLWSQIIEGISKSTRQRKCFVTSSILGFRSSEKSYEHFELPFFNFHWDSMNQLSNLNIEILVRKVADISSGTFWKLQISVLVVLRHHNWWCSRTSLSPLAFLPQSEPATKIRNQYRNLSSMNYQVWNEIFTHYFSGPHKCDRKAMSDGKVCKKVFRLELKRCLAFFCTLRCQ